MMHNFITGIKASVRGNAVKEAELGFSKNGKPVLTRRVACGGFIKNNIKQPATFIDVEVWGSAAEKLVEISFEKGRAMVAEGALIVEKNQRNGVWFTNVKLQYLTHLEVEDDSGDLVEIVLERDDKKAVKEKVDAGLPF